ncbi:MAG: 16S rRNA (cytosine(1402)-N(4))-methyltransferase RsmH [Thermoanaerobaculia bacterium]
MDTADVGDREQPRHLPVLVEEAIGFLDPARGGCYVDCTVGLGGHTAALLERFPAVRAIGLDRDDQALGLAAERLAVFGDRVTLANGCFDELGRRLKELGIGRVQGVLADLGVSSLQLGDSERGFAFGLDGPLDMRMGAGELSAAEIVNRYSEEELTKILREYGEERWARRIAREIIGERQTKPFETTAELRRLVERVKPLPPLRYKARRVRRPGGRTPGGRRRIHPATQTFQALRIEVNRELEQVRELLEQSVNMLERDGRLVVISYHSLEDRIVKHRLRELAAGEIEPITGRPRTETQVIEVMTKRPVRPGADELAANPRSRSARLRAARRL